MSSKMKELILIDNKILPAQQGGELFFLSSVNSVPHTRLLQHPHPIFDPVNIHLKISILKKCNYLLTGGGKSSPFKNFGKIILSQLLCIGAVFTACTDDEVINQTGKAPLQVSVNASLAKQSRAIVHGEYLPAGSSIGVSLFTPEGDDYDGQGYYNIQYKATGEEEDQTWASTGVTPAVSANEAELIAYYPYNSAEDLDVFALPIENASQTDYMFSGPVAGITNASPKADITFYHALTAIRVKLVLGDFTGDIDVSEIAMASPGLALSATLNAVTGELSEITGQGDKFALPVEFDLSDAGTTNDVMFVPDLSVEEGSTTVSATIGGKKYTAAISFDEAYKQGYIYTYTLTLNNSGFSVTKVNVNPWEQGNDDAATLEPEKDDIYSIKIKAYYDNYDAQDVILFEHNVVDFVGTIDWGDGTTSTYNEPVIYPSHEYPNDGTEYTITAKGSIRQLNNLGDPIEHNWIDRNRNWFCAVFRELIGIGKDCGIVYMHNAFYGCYNITSIPSGIFDGCTEVIDFSNAFQHCAFTEIPDGLFDKCTKVVNFEGTFAQNDYLVTIPEGLFDKCTEVTNFMGVFGVCGGITEIPEGLFDYNTKVLNFGHVFRNTAITEIPEGLFDYNTEVTSFESAFYYCPNLKKVPTNLFDNNRKVTDLKVTFHYCSNTEGESPYTIINIDGVDTKVYVYQRVNYPELFATPKISDYDYNTGFSDIAN